MDTLTAVVSLAAPLLSLPMVLKVLAEFRSLPRINARAEYIFARDLADRTGDPNIVAHSEELGYRALVGGGNLTSGERKILLSLADSSQIIPRYQRVSALLSVHASAPVLRWRRHRHERPRIRKFLIYGLNGTYFLSAMAGILPFLLRTIPGQAAGVSRMAGEVPVLLSAAFIVVAVFSLYHGVILSVASELIREAALRRPAVDPDMQD